jgi:hypothetical protein
MFYIWVISFCIMLPGVGGWRGLGRKPAHAKYKYPAVEVTSDLYRLFLPSGNCVGVFVSPASLQYGVFICIWRAIITNLREGETHARGVTQTGGITDFIGATAGTFCKGSYNFEIFGHNHLDCVIK